MKKDLRLVKPELAYVSWEEAVEIVKGGDLQALSWRHHKLGMLQGELTETTRVHIWHPELYIPGPGLRIHDHRFHLTSHVLYGDLVDETFHATVNPELIGWPTSDVVHPLYEVRHAKVQTGEHDTTYIGHVDLRTSTRQCHSARDMTTRTYSVERRTFHLTRLQGLAITFVQRSNFDDNPARVVHGAESGISRNTSEHLIKALVLMASEKVRRL